MDVISGAIKDREITEIGGPALDAEASTNAPGAKAQASAPTAHDDDGLDIPEFLRRQ
jgi:hypothetical protein